MTIPLAHYQQWQSAISYGVTYCAPLAWMYPKPIIEPRAIEAPAAVIDRYAQLPDDTWAAYDTWAA